MEKPLAKMKITTRMKNHYQSRMKVQNLKKRLNTAPASFLHHLPPLLLVAFRNLTMGFSWRILY